MKHISLGGLDVSRRCETVAVNTEHFEAHLLLVDWASPGSAEALGSLVAGQAEEGIGDPALVSASASYLASDVVQAVRRQIR